MLTVIRQPSNRILTYCRPKIAPLYLYGKLKTWGKNVSAPNADRLPCSGWIWPRVNISMGQFFRAYSRLTSHAIGWVSFMADTWDYVVEDCWGYVIRTFYWQFVSWEKWPSFFKTLTPFSSCCCHRNNQHGCVVSACFLMVHSHGNHMWPWLSLNARCWSASFMVI